MDVTFNIQVLVFRKSRIGTRSEVLDDVMSSALSVSAQTQGYYSSLSSPLCHCVCFSLFSYLSIQRPNLDVFELHEDSRKHITGAGTPMTRWNMGIGKGSMRWEEGNTDVYGLVGFA